MDRADCSISGEQSDVANKLAPSRTTGTECRAHGIRISSVQIRRSKFPDLSNTNDLQLNDVHP